MQNDQRFNIIQRGDPNTHAIWVGGYESLVVGVNQCFASNSNNYRYIDFLKGTSIARESMTLTFGFSIPNDANTGRQYTLVGTGPCDDDLNQGSFTVNYVVQNGQGGLLTVEALLSDRFSRTSGESTLTLTCVVSPTVNPVNNNQPLHVWVGTKNYRNVLLVYFNNCWYYGP